MSEQVTTQAHLTIVNNTDIESITIEYARNQSTSTPPDANTGGWSTTRPSWAQGYYIWQRTRIHKTGTAASADTFGAAVCLTGSAGTNGATIWTATADPTTPNYTFSISKLTGQSNRTPQIGDIVVRSYYRYTITSVGTDSVLTGTRTSIRGGTGATGPEAIVVITPSNINWDANNGNGSATLTATLRVDGAVTTPTSISYKWTKGTEDNISLGDKSTLNVNDLNATYNCTVTWE